MFKVKWITRFNDHRPIAIEDSILIDVDKVFTSCRERLYGKRFERFGVPPDGFVICDEDGKELRRWLASEIEPDDAIVPSRSTSNLPSRRYPWRDPHGTQESPLRR